VYVAGAILVMTTLLCTSCAGSNTDKQASAQSAIKMGLDPATGPLRVNPDNPRYFTDDSGRAIYLTGSHTWANLQDLGSSDPPPVFDYTAYLDFLEANHHDFFRLWAWEQAKWAPWTASDIWFAPAIYQRPGPGEALDGKPKFDLSSFDQAYFDRMRARIIEAGNRGIYVSIMLFDGWSVGQKGGGPGNPWPGHPYNASNNINGIDGDPDGDGNGYEVETLAMPEITALQEAYVQKVIDTVNDLDNVLYEICNESNGGPGEISWQYHMIDFIHDYEATQPKQHPVGMTVPYPDGENSDLFNGPAEWISPNAAGGYQDDPPVADGSKVVVVDTDHLWGVGGDREWLWKSFTRGLNALYMDCYDPIYCEGWDPNDPTRLSVVVNMGYTLEYANRMNLVAMTPRPDLCSTEYCLANPVAVGAEYLVYLPEGGTETVDLSATPGELAVEWLDPSDGAITEGLTVTGGTIVPFTPPFGGDAVLYLSQVGPLTISNVAAHPLDTSAWITWDTDRPATSQVEYGISPTLGISTTPTASYVVSHSVRISGLMSSTEYYYQVRSTDVSGQSAQSEISSFTTLAPEDIRWIYLPIILKG
jgi:hypothetical protein